MSLLLAFYGSHVIHIVRTCPKLQILRIDESCSRFELTKRMADLLPATVSTCAQKSVKRSMLLLHCTCIIAERRAHVMSYLVSSLLLAFELVMNFS